MKKQSKTAAWLLCGAMLLSGAVPVAAADAPTLALKTTAQAAADLGVLQGEGSGVTDAYLAKSTTRLQTAIMYLRLKGQEQAALAFKGSDNFSDANAVNASNQAILAYLKANPQLGWTGTGNGKFEPLAQITAQQYYKVLLEALGYKQDADFQYENVITYAKSVGLNQIAGAGALRNSNIATATVEALKAQVKGGKGTLLDDLVDQKVIAKDKAAALQGTSTSLKIGYDAALGAYLTDDAGKTLYMYTKDMTDMSVCVDKCVANWPLYSPDSLLIPAELSAADFKTISRDDGKKQLTYKGMPLYYFVKDTKAGDISGQGVNNVWYIVHPEPASPAALAATEPAASAAQEVQINISGFAFSEKELTVNAGTKITFTNMDKVKHNAVSDLLGADGKPVFETKLLAQGESESIVLTQPGEYTYYCQPHKAAMKAKIIVK
ncbi:plastocyanin/azurin family copper-binding protein [Paenibacillus filicis]|uniref:Plastocyanin/azurin family copper-binding protein n=1 Tax=Paenibacillus gyeongsangnamensis TaxID=3388067 RepID=A0ABT4Q3A2_9BACL|nr:plastocyanin/azurin family copper-binding protein [Paenibacillus filicis]MCZ8511307.1 plastocyanin/azurin family copper-binding protein [Paenibacillus filicis]